jgi:cell division protein ZapA (FtsZ GTPase activity inhibitor)
MREIPDKRLISALTELLVEINCLEHDEAITIMAEASAEAYNDIGCGNRGLLVSNVLAMAGVVALHCANDNEEQAGFYAGEAKDPLADLTQAECEEIEQEHVQMHARMQAVGTTVALMHRDIMKAVLEDGR